MSKSLAPLTDFRVGVRFEPSWPPEELPEFARWAEGAGYDELWFSEDLPRAGAMVMATTALALTERIRVGIGLLPALTRNVATAAMEIAALSRIAPGRLVIALGNGVPAWMRQIGARPSSPLIALRETVLTLRQLLAGDEVSFAGRHVQLDRVRLGLPPGESPELLIGTTGQAGLRLAGELSDGVLLPELATPQAVRWARDEMNAAGLAGSTIIFAMVSVDDDRDWALAQMRPRVQWFVDSQWFPKLSEFAGLGADGSGAVTDEILRSVAPTGTPADCAQTVRTWVEAGATGIVVVAGDHEPRQSYQRFAREVLPLVR